MNKNESDPNEPVTRREFDEAMQFIANAFEKVATKEELKQLATKEELKQLATKEELKKVQQTQEAILTVVQSTAAQVKELSDKMNNIPERVEVLEEDMIKVKSRLF